MTHVVVGTAGHIDHGKSALVQALTGTDPDRLQEEKARGITIELGFAHATVAGVRLAFVDVPGHERFVKTMIAGVGGLDCVMLVIAADESVMPQTREHFDICRLLRVRHGVVVLSKCDLVDEDTLGVVRLEVAELVRGSFLAGAPVLAVSTRSGDGLQALAHTLAAVAPHVTRERQENNVRLPIDRAFVMQGFGTVVTGTLVAGTLAVQQELVVEPGHTPVRVRGLQVHGQARETAVAGERTAVNLSGVSVEDVSRGETLTTVGGVTVTRRVDASLELLPSAAALRHGARVRCSQGTSEVLGRVSLAATASDRLPPGAEGFVRFRLEQPLALQRGDRFIVRAYSPPRTIGGGSVLDPAPARVAVRTAKATERFAALAGDTVQAVTQMVHDSGSAGLPRVSLPARAGLPLQNMSSVTERLVSNGHVSVVGELLIATGELTRARERLLAAVDDHHRQDPLSAGLPREEARTRVAAHGSAAVFDEVVAALLRAGTLRGQERLARNAHVAQPRGEDQPTWAAIEAVYAAAGLRSPDVSALSEQARITEDAAAKIVAVLVRQQRLVKIGALVFHPAALATLKAALKDGTGPATLDVAFFKERFGVSRKFAIPLLEWLDRERVTRRVGDSRVVL